MSTNFDEDKVYLPQCRNLREILSNTKAFQRQLGLTVGDPNSPTSAQERIFFPAIETERLLAELPAALIQVGVQLNMTPGTGGTQIQLDGEGQLRLNLLDKSRYPNDLQAATEDFVAWIGAVVTQILDVSGVSDRLQIAPFTQEMEPQISNEVESASSGPWFLARYLVTWS